MTGGYSQDSGQSGRVTRYDRHGLVRRLNNLQEGRAGHGCTQFINNDGIKVGIFLIININPYVQSTGKHGSWRSQCIDQELHLII